MSTLQKYILTRVLQIIPVLLAIVTIDFLIIHLVPGDPAILLAGPDASQQYLNSIRAQFGLNKPIYEQYFIYIYNLLQGNLGISVLSRRPVLDVVLERVEPTLLLMLTAWFVSLVLGIFLGTKAGLRKGSLLDQSLSVITLTMYSIPVFWLAVMLVSLFALRLGIVPIAGMENVANPGVGIGYGLDVASHMILPITCMVTFYMPQFYQLTRVSVASTLEEDFVRTLQATGLEKTSLYSRYILKNASLPVITLAGLWVGYALTGAVLIEVVFDWPGLGILLFNSAISRDYPVLLGIFLVAAVMVVIVVLITDLIYIYVDPRMRYEKATT
ncbi:MAG: ABC transporter permease [Thermoplasmata archaeon]|jgi:peptide/nickel transport system permease protein